ncbi:MAG TPA: hypothetical protein VNQ31_00705 [Sphingomonadaceae bacterium]|nr:hypothetical protein [Sphingomonadaceae bacterium]
MRFVIGVVGLWIGARVFLLARWPAPAPVTLARRAITPTPAQTRRPASPAPFTVAPVLPPAAWQPAPPAAWSQPALARPALPAAGSREPPILLPVSPAYDSPPRVAPPAPLIVTPHPPSSARWTGDAYLFLWGGGGGPSLAAGGQLGASQAAARISYALDRSLSLSGRLYAPLDHPEASEGALGVDWRPAPDVPLRLSVERRFAAGKDGRAAWSAYLAGGFFQGGLPGRFEADGYAQAGIVGARRRDGFGDAAIRITRPITLDHQHVIRIGGAGWAAAQPGAARIDLGPRAAISLPLGPTTVVAAFDYRVRIAGHARPGSGATLTLSTGF